MRRYHLVLSSAICCSIYFSISPTNLLNATCVADITSNYTVFNTTNGNMTTACGISHPEVISRVEVEIWVKIIFIAFICVAFLYIISCLKMRSRLGTIRNLWSTPSYELHEKLEDRYSSNLQPQSKRKKYEEDHAGRYKSVTYEDNMETKTRTITIIEDLTKVPPKKDEEEERKKDKKRQENVPLRTLPQQDDGRNAPSWTPTGQAWARSQARYAPLPKFRESLLGGRTNENVALAVSFAESRAMDGEQQDLDFPPLTYSGQGQGERQQYRWTDYV